MARYLGLLAWDALSCPFRDVLIQRGPNHLCADGLARALDARVTQTVYGIEDGFPEGVRDKRPCRTVADIDYETRLTDVYALKVEAGPHIVPETPEVGVQGLLRGNGVPVYAEGRYGVDHAFEVLESGFLACGCAVES